MAGTGERRAVLIAGPTAAGKTAAALARAEGGGAVIVNADSMQVYSHLRVLTARPGAAELARAPHLLFGHVHPSERYSVGKWLKDVEELLPDLERDAVVPIFVGGTGLYFKALTEGLSEIPTIDRGIDPEFRGELEAMGAEGRRAMMVARDPEMAARLEGFDPQRVGRALTVLKATGRSLAEWQDAAGKPPLAGWRLERVVLAPPREVLRGRIAARLAAMLDAGAVEEVRTLLAMALDDELPAMKAIGVREIAAMLGGKIDRAEAERLAVNATRQYAKRQMTWLRKHMADWTWQES